MSPPRTPLPDLLARIADAIHLKTERPLVEDDWIDRFGDGYAWSLGIKCSEGWTIGTVDHSMSENRADFLELDGPFRDAHAAAERTLAAVQAALTARRPVW